MSIVIGYALTLIGWQGLRSFLGDFVGNGAVWLLIGFLSAIVVLSALATQAALVLHAPHRQQSRTRWPVSLSGSTIPESSGQASPIGSGTPR